MVNQNIGHVYLKRSHSHKLLGVVIPDVRNCYYPTNHTASQNSIIKT